MAKFCTWFVVLSIHICLAQNESAPKATVDKTSENKPAHIAGSHVTTLKPILISEKSLQSEHIQNKEGNPQSIDSDSNHSQNGDWPYEYEKALKRIDIENSVRTGFYFLMTISVGALVFVCWKVYKLRMSRAERKYGVTGDRSTQELAPLPISMEDVDSDEEDHTIFDAHRNQIRIF